MSVIDKIKFRQFRKKWRQKNSHNETAALTIFPQELVTVGRHTYGGLNVLAFNTVNRLSIGHFVSIGPETMFLLSADHYSDHISTYPFKSKILTGEFEGVSKGDIVIEDDVWIGFRTVILSGVHVGQGAIIASGSIVTKDVPPYTVVGGCPTKEIRKRFSPDVIEYLCTLDYDKLTDDDIKRHENDLYSSASDEDINTLKKQYEWFPKKDEKKIQHG